MYGSTAALPVRNIGRFCVSRIWMRRPSLVMSSSNCGRNWRSTGLFSMICSRRFFRPRSRSLSIWSRRRWASAAGSLVCAFMISPSLAVTSLPPPGITLVERLLLSPPAIATLSGVRKYSATPTRTFGDEELSSHSTRKSAIMAVMKSA